MLKKITLAALAALSMCAFAQDAPAAGGGMMGDDHTSMYDMRKHVLEAADVLSFADQYFLLSYLQRLPANQEQTVIRALHNAAVRISEMGGMGGGTTGGATGGDAMATGAADDGSDRMRMYMEMSPPRMVSHREALDIFAEGLNSTEESLLTMAYMRSERFRDVMVRFLRKSGMEADRQLTSTRTGRGMPMGGGTGGGSR